MCKSRKKIPFIYTLISQWKLLLTFWWLPLNHTKYSFFKRRFHLFLERGEEREKERETSTFERETSTFERDIDKPPLSCPIQGPQPTLVPWLRIELATFQFVGWHPTQWVTPVRVEHTILNPAFFPKRFMVSIFIGY